MLSDMGVESVSANSVNRSFESVPKNEVENGNDNPHALRRLCCEQTPVCEVWPISGVREKNKRSVNSIAVSSVGSGPIRPRNRLRLKAAASSASLTECGLRSMMNGTFASSFFSGRSRTTVLVSEGCASRKEMGLRQTGVLRFIAPLPQENWLG